MPPFAMIPSAISLEISDESLTVCLEQCDDITTKVYKNDQNFRSQTCPRLQNSNFPNDVLNVNLQRR